MAGTKHKRAREHALNNYGYHNLLKAKEQGTLNELGEQIGILPRYIREYLHKYAKHNAIIPTPPTHS